MNNNPTPTVHFLPPRYVMIISVHSVTPDGDEVSEVAGVTIDKASTDIEALTSVMEELYDVGEAAIRRLVPMDTVSERRPTAHDYPSSMGPYDLDYCAD